MTAAPAQPLCNLCAEREDHLHAVADMIMRQCPVEETLSEICQGAGQRAAEREMVIFLLDGEEWRLAGRGQISPQSSAALEIVDPASLSAAIATWENASGQQGFPCESGWARRLWSGLGELLGMLLCFADGPMQPFGVHAARIESACRLATLALEQKNLLSELTFQANHDALTGLLNRAHFDRELRAALRVAAARGRMVALLYIDLDRFRVINDILGHHIGDKVLVEVAGRFHACLRRVDVMARTSGDEFAILLPHLDDPRQATLCAEALLQALSQPCAVDGHQIFVGASAGVVCSTAASTAETLERESFLALYQAKQAGRRRAVTFHPSMAGAPPERLEMEKRLRFALERRELTIYYQPQVRLSDRAVVGAEALLRWQPEGLGMISPATFVPILEESGLIIEVGRWVLREACRQAMLWAERFPPLRMAVNVSAVQIRDSGLVSDVEQALRETGLPPERLEVELTESCFVGDFDAAMQTFEGLRRAGVTLALDDFGTGQASIAYLRKLPFDRLKLDQSFVRPIREGEPCPPLVESILTMARTLGMSSISEGIETAYQLSLLARAGSIEGQGYYFSRPVPPAQFEDFMEALSHQLSAVS